MQLKHILQLTRLDRQRSHFVILAYVGVFGGLLARFAKPWQCVSFLSRGGRGTFIWLCY